MVNVASFPGDKAAGHEGNHSPPSRAEVKNAWSYIYPLSYMSSWRGANLSTGCVFTAWYFGKMRDKFTFIFTN